jgi:molybdenum cofactor guanylyltransferase/molybdopterin-guanine dinucleotide biosynthesis protein MobB
MIKTSPLVTITGVILAGGQARRMGGDDKGLINYQNKPLISYTLNTLAPQVDHLIINANRNVDRYSMFGFPIISDSIDGFQGPLAGMLAALEAVDSDYILTAPCDSPAISKQLRQRMMEGLLLQQADIAVAFDGERLQPVFSLIPKRLKDDLKAFLLAGERKIDRWFEQHKLAVVDFSDQKQTFLNFNHPEDLKQSLIHQSCSIPVLGISAFSGTGKTTLLTQLLPQLKQQNINVGVIKHAHHLFDIDKPGKDSYQIREAGAHQMLIASKKMMALMQKQLQKIDEPSLLELLPRLDQSQLDLILVEGFKHDAFNKIELHRPALDKPLLYPEDNNIIAIASDESLELQRPIEQLDLNDIASFVAFIKNYMASWKNNND